MMMDMAEVAGIGVGPGGAGAIIGITQLPPRPSFPVLYTHTNTHTHTHTHTLTHTHTDTHTDTHTH
jgi:hypothetical protein